MFRSRNNVLRHSNKDSNNYVYPVKLFGEDVHDENLQANQPEKLECTNVLT
jgi:hypothetical protein